MTIEVSADFGVQLRALRRAAGLTQEQLAERAGLSVQAIAALENGRSRRPYPHTVRALADALRLDPERRAALIAAVPGRAATDEAQQPASTTHLPAVTPHLIGRERDLRAIQDALRRGVRILTLTGAGGVGKTTLATHLAANGADVFPDGVVFVPLASVHDPALVLPTILHAVPAQETGARTTLEVLVAFFSGKRTLLVLDNVEQVLAAAPALSQLVRATDGVTLLVTSRAPLRVVGEREYPVQPLPVPELARIPSVEEVAGNAAVELFVERAQAVSPDFHLDRANAAVVAAICRRLDGLPLAIELAAARLRLLSPVELLSRLDTALPILSGGARDLPERQRTMRDAIEWSYNLLDDRERRLFRALAVFRDGWTLEATEAVCSDAAMPPMDVFELLAALVEQSLVIAERQEDGRTRYRFLMPVRELAEELLVEAGEAEACRRRHMEYCLALTDRAAVELAGPGQVAWLARLEIERDNIRAALGWLMDRREWELATRIGWNLWVFWWVHGYYAEGREAMARVIEEGRDLTPQFRAWALGVVGEMAFGQGDIASARASCEESAALFLEVGDRHSAARIWLVLGLIASGAGDLETARRYLQDATDEFLAAGVSPYWASLTTSALGMLPFRQGDYDRAEALVAEGLALARKAGDRFSRYIALYNASRVALKRGDLNRAAELFREGLRFSADANDRANVAYCLEGLAAIAVARDQPRLAARLLGGAHALFEVVGGRVYTYRPDSALREQTETAVRARLDEESWAKAWAEGEAMPMRDIVALGLSIPDRAG